MNKHLLIKTGITISFVSFLAISVKLLSAEEQHENQDDLCAGKTYNGAWFDVRVPEGFTVQPSLLSVSNEGYDSVWLRSHDGGFDLYIYSPQWSGEPSDVLDDPQISGITENTQINDHGTVTEVTVIVREIAYKNGQYGKFTSNQTIHNNHLTTGYRLSNQTLSESQNQIHRCFLQSIQQYAD